MLLVGLLGIGKIIIVEVFGKIYVGMGIVCYFEIWEVCWLDFCGYYIGELGFKMNELIEKLFGWIIFMDEFYLLIECY